MFGKMLLYRRGLTGFGRRRYGRLGRACGANPPYLGGRPQPRGADCGAGRGGGQLHRRVGGGVALTHPGITVHWLLEHHHTNNTHLAHAMFTLDTELTKQSQKKTPTLENDC